MCEFEIFQKKNPNCWGREAKIWYTHNCSHTSASCLEVRDKTLRKRHKSKQGMGKFVPSPRPRFTSISSCTDLCKRLWICKPHLLIQRCWDDGQQGQMGKSLSSQGWPSVQRAGFFWSSELENVSFFTLIKLVYFPCSAGAQTQDLGCMLSTYSNPVSLKFPWYLLQNGMRHHSTVKCLYS